MMDNRKDITAKIKEYYAQGKPLNISSVKDYDPGLMEAVYSVKPYWGWKKALEDAGLTYTDIKQEATDRVTCLLCGKKMRHIVSHVRHVHKVLPSEYSARFPGEEMVAPSVKLGFIIPDEGDIEISNWDITWTREYFLDKVREYYERGFNICSNNIIKLDHPVYIWAQTYYKSWLNALIAAQIVPQSVPTAEVEEDSGRAALIMRINQLYIVDKNGCYQSYVVFNPHILYRDFAQFDSFEEMLGVCGIDRASVNHLKIPNILYESKAEMLDHIYRRYKRGQHLGKRRNMSGELEMDGVLAFACKKAFGKWLHALEKLEKIYEIDLVVAGGLRRRGKKYPDKKSVIAALKERVAKNLSLRVSDIKEGTGSDYTLLEYMKKYFGTSAAAYKAAGIDSRVFAKWVRKGHEQEAKLFFERFPSREATAREIERLAEQKVFFSRSRLISGETADPLLYKAILKYFGSLSQAMQALNIVDPLVYNPGRHKKSKIYLSKKAVITELQRRRDNNVPLGPSDLMKSKEHRDLALYCALKSLFGSSVAAYEAAGIDSGRVMRKFIYIDQQKIKTKEGLIEVMKELYQQHETKPRGKYLAWHTTIRIQAKKLFGSFKAARAAAGIPVVYAKMTKAQKQIRTLKMEIRKRVKNSMPMNPGALQNSKSAEDKKLFYTACEQFGSWRAAITDTGLNYDEVIKR